MKLKLPSFHPHDVIRALAAALEIPSRKDCLEEIVELPAPYGKGKIIGFNFSEGIGMLILNCRFKEDVDLLVESEAFPPLQLNFNVAGGMQHHLSNNMIHYHLNPLQGSVVAGRQGTHQHLRFSSDVDIVYTSILIDRETYFNKIECVFDQMPDELVRVFADTEAQRTFYYHSNYSIAASEIITKIIQDENDGLVRCAFLEGKALELISKLMKQYKDDLLMPTKQVVLRKYDLDKIKLARKRLTENLKEAPTIEQLSSLVGINRQKLKTGFKSVYGNTIFNALREERLERASLLLMSGMSVKETAEEVGYANQSHFATRFKEKYGVLPKDYLKAIRSKLEV